MNDLGLIWGTKQIPKIITYLAYIKPTINNLPSDFWLGEDNQQE